MPDNGPYVPWGYGRWTDDPSAKLGPETVKRAKEILMTKPLTTEDHAFAVAERAYNAAMRPRDGDEPRECMWAAVHAVRDIYESKLYVIERGIRKAMALLEGQTPQPNEAHKVLQDACAGYDIVEED